jgi:hypothetical protein
MRGNEEKTGANRRKKMSKNEMVTLCETIKNFGFASHVLLVSPGLHRHNLNPTTNLP